MPVLEVNNNTSAYPQELLDKWCGKKLVVVCGGRCVWDDLASINVTGQNPNGFDIMTVNDITMHYDGKVKHVYSNDHRWLPKWIEARRELISREYGGIQYVHTCLTGARYVWPWPGHGTSALGAVYTGLAMGYDQIVLCGAPLDNSGHYFDPPWKETRFISEIATKNGELRYWAQAKEKIFNDKVRSQSGRTRELLGPLGS